MAKQKMDFDELKSQIMFQEWTNDELVSLWQAIKYSRERLAKQVVWTLRHGANVKFTNSRNGQVMVGKVTKINRKFVKVQVGMTIWTVPAAMLSAA